MFSIDISNTNLWNKYRIILNEERGKTAIHLILVLSYTWALFWDKFTDLSTPGTTIMGVPIPPRHIIVVNLKFGGRKCLQLP